MQLLFIELIQAALAKLLGVPGVSFPATPVRIQFACNAGFVLTALLFHATDPVDEPEK